MTQDNELVSRLAKRIYANLHHLMGVAGTKAQDAYESAARAVIEEARIEALVAEKRSLREALTDIRNRVLCPVGPAPTIDELQEIASAALESEQ